MITHIFILMSWSVRVAQALKHVVRIILEVKPFGAITLIWDSHPQVLLRNEACPRVAAIDRLWHGI